MEKGGEGERGRQRCLSNTGAVGGPGGKAGGARQRHAVRGGVQRLRNARHFGLLAWVAGIINGRAGGHAQEKGPRPRPACLAGGAPEPISGVPHLARPALLPRRVAHSAAGVVARVAGHGRACGVRAEIVLGACSGAGGATGTGTPQGALPALAGRTAAVRGVVPARSAGSAGGNSAHTTPRSRGARRAVPFRVGEPTQQRKGFVVE